MCEYVAVMYAGHIVEYTDVNTLFSNPLHPYTLGLNKSIPRMDTEVERLDTIKGLVPNLLNLPPGCPFYPRCDYRLKKCLQEMPELVEVENRHLVKCHLVEGKK